MPIRVKRYGMSRSVLSEEDTALSQLQMPRPEQTAVVTKERERLSATSRWPPRSPRSLPRATLGRAREARVRVALEHRHAGTRDERSMLG